MKNLFLLCSFLLFANWSFGQLVITNETGFPITAGAQLTCETPNTCPTSTVENISTTEPLPDGESTSIDFPSPMSGCAGPYRPFIIGAGLFGGGSESWIRNPVWNAVCGTTGSSSGPFTIVVTYSSSTETHVTISL